jgi:hypothetical protein
VHQHHRHGQRARGEQLVDRLIAPVGVVARVRDELLPEAELIEAALPAQLADRAGAQVQIVVVGDAGPPLVLVLAAGLLLVDVRDVDLPERAVVEPVVAEPAVDHRVHRHRDLERRVRIDQRHQRREAVVRDAEDADPAVGLGDVLHQPVDRVVGVGGVIDRGRVLRAAQRPVDDVVALGAVLAADVLDHADVAAVDDHVGDVVVALQRRAEVRAGPLRGHAVGVVRRAGQEHRRALGAARHQDHRVQLHAVAHRDHLLAALEVEAGGARRERRRDLRRQRRRRRRGLGGRGGDPDRGRAEERGRQREGEPRAAARGGAHGREHRPGAGR